MTRPEWTDNRHKQTDKEVFDLARTDAEWRYNNGDFSSYEDCYYAVLEQLSYHLAPCVNDETMRKHVTCIADTVWGL